MGHGLRERTTALGQEEPFRIRTGVTEKGRFAPLARCSGRSMISTSCEWLHQAGFLPFPSWVAVGAAAPIPDVTTSNPVPLTSDSPGVRVSRRRGSELLTIQTDLTKDSAAEEITKATPDRFGRIDILVNNAGIGPGAIRADSWQRPLKFQLSVTPLFRTSFVMMLIVVGNRPDE
jgi:hypothetical protein